MNGGLRLASVEHCQGTGQNKEGTWNQFEFDLKRDIKEQDCLLQIWSDGVKTENRAVSAMICIIIVRLLTFWLDSEQGEYLMKVDVERTHSSGPLLMLPQTDMMDNCRDLWSMKRPRLDAHHLEILVDLS
jgi:hypothetical protein